MLERKGLVETQHTNPQQFRAVPISEAIALLRREYNSRARELADTLEGLESLPSDDDEEIVHEVWSLSGEAAIENRTQELVDVTEKEIVSVVGREEAFTDDLKRKLNDASANGTSVIVGSVTDDLRDLIRESLPEVEVFTSGLEWLQNDDGDVDDTTISRLLLVDRETILVSSVHSSSNSGVSDSAVLGRGLDNGFVVISRRLMATGLKRRDDPGKS